MVQRSDHVTCGYHGWSPCRTCQFSKYVELQHFSHMSPMFFVVNGNRLSPEPACQCFQLLFGTVAAIWHLRGKGQLPILLQRDRGYTLFVCTMEFSTMEFQILPALLFYCQVYSCCVLHVRCIPTSQVDKQVWASVLLMLDSKRQHDLLGEYLSR